VLATQSFDALLDDWHSTTLRELRLAMQVNGALFTLFQARTPNLETLVLEQPSAGTLTALCTTPLLTALRCCESPRRKLPRCASWLRSPKL
jgi:hypothetical protein